MKRVVMFFFFLFLTSCKQNEKENSFMEYRRKEITLTYHDDLKKTKISNEFMSHFPFKIVDLPIKLHFNTKVSEGIIYSMLFEFNVNKQKRDSINAFLREKYVQKYLSSDPDLIVIRRKTLRTENYKKTKVTHPIPFFETYCFSNAKDVVTTGDVYDHTTKSGLSKEFKIYVLESKKGKYWKKLESKKYMPEEWENGYSKGVAINDKKYIIIYWVVIW